MWKLSSVIIKINVSVILQTKLTQKEGDIKDLI